MPEQLSPEPEIDRPPEIFTPPEMPGELLSIDEVPDDEKEVVLREVAEVLYGRLVGEWQNARFDTLTGRPNRRWLEGVLDWLVKNKAGNFAVAFIDLDGTKQINDTQGHAAGNQYLKTASRNLQRTVNTINHGQEEVPGNVEVAVRLSGDEFVLIVYSVSSQEDLNEVMALVVQRLAVDNVQASIGGRLHRISESSAELLEEVDSLMYQEKQRKRDEAFGRLSRRRRLAAWAGMHLLNYAGMKPPR